jgi:hypothetical protein
MARNHVFTDTQCIARYIRAGECHWQTILHSFDSLKVVCLCLSGKYKAVCVATHKHCCSSRQPGLGAAPSARSAGADHTSTVLSWRPWVRKRPLDHNPTVRAACLSLILLLKSRDITIVLSSREIIIRTAYARNLYRVNL